MLEGLLLDYSAMGLKISQIMKMSFREDAMEKSIKNNIGTF